MALPYVLRLLEEVDSSLSLFWLFFFFSLMLFGTRVKSSRSCAQWEVLHIWHFSELWHWQLEQSQDEWTWSQTWIFASIRIQNQKSNYFWQLSFMQVCKAFSPQKQKMGSTLWSDMSSVNSAVYAPYNCSYWLATSGYCVLLLILEPKYKWCNESREEKIM